MKSLQEILLERSHHQCELCSQPTGLSLYQILPVKGSGEDSSLIVCATCRGQIENPQSLDANHWRCLNTSMWSELTPVQVMTYRMLSLLGNEVWARELLEQLYLDEDNLQWAKAGLPEATPVDDSLPTVDSNGSRLVDGDSVTLIKDLDVKGAGFTAKRGTLVRNISLTSNPKHIEGKVNGIGIVLIAEYLKKV